ncbi:MAG: phosphatidylserine decarboxylase [Enterobacterales bacterium]|nr:phosphatidylserine decarboxylase [Enterobacterales bacterium]
MNQEALKTFYQYLIPQHGISRLVGKLAASETNWIKNSFINWFAKKYQVDLSEAVIEHPTQYKNFNDFFTRALKADARPLAENCDLICPVDGQVSQLGPIEGDDIFQAKGQKFGLEKLIGNETLAKPYRDGDFATLYLSPKDYHRIHCPIDAKLTAMTYIPGQLFSVNHITARTIPGLFARNERLVVHLETDLGPIAMTFVGAIIVASIETVWSGLITPPRGPSIRTWTYTNNDITFKAGDEMARFRLGSTVILTAPKGALEWFANLEAGSDLRLGQALATRKE